ncbi:hypothetical protein [Staphylococcus equorum]|uniref:Uncharacterized protein n=1 Tax=Staphylococcus equorum TaxID=246432 RepID=A0AAP7IDZ4_9STAP|nr:hypothetical protein [Staphylococcus equorum]OEK56598.1 hypothetical protein ASS97_06110 [Staphylococcus equorum]OEK58302.1 hypothetical protein ASS94_03965 [Staphylococcus equorum]OEK63604.1 hypothetical protein ASS99_01305 [Staphylococcus equorum]OEK64940.1 hypothetical protein ASS98_01930 [Staphylococcus equorum]RYD12839.1 hypothetical protein CGA19_04690 [Staphylococcus equorum]
MARKEITTPLDLKNMDNHNYNYDELYGLIDETDRRISEDMWEEIKKANTMTMLEPVQTSSELPSEAPDKSFITVIDEQRVYTYFQGEWQPFNEIDLDPFEPFKEELAAIVAAYEKQIQSITTEVQNTKTSAIDSIQSTQTQSEASIIQTKQSAIESIESTQTQSESNINQTKQSAINSINQTQTEVESQISTIRDEMTTQASDLTALFNDHMAQLTSKQDTALAEVESAKQAAITALEDFNNTDTSNWQKFKLTQDNGGAKDLTSFDWADSAQLDALEAGQYYAAASDNTPIGASSYNAFVTVIKRAGEGIKRIEFKPYNSNQLFIKRFYETWGEWEPAQGANVVLFEGSSKGVGSLINLKKELNEYASITISGHYPGGRFNETHLLYNYDSIPINKVNLRDSDGGAPIDYEVVIKIKNDSTLIIEKETKNNLFGTDTGSNTETHFEINYIMGWT